VNPVAPCTNTSARSAIARTFAQCAYKKSAGRLV
jgi:hypothetical protein